MDMFHEEEYNKPLDFSVWKRLFKFASPFKKQLAVVFVIMILVGGVEASFPLVTKAIIDRFVIPGTLDGFVPFCLFALGIAMVQAILIKIMILVAGKLETEVPYSIRKAGFQRLQELSLSYFDTKPVGWLMARMTSDIKKLGTTLSWNVVDIVWAISMMSIMVVLMLVLNWKLALLVLSTVPFLIAISFYFQRRILKNFRKARRINSRITGAFNEGIMGAKTIKTLVMEKEFLKEFSQITEELRNASLRAATLSSLYTPAVILLGSIGTALILWYGGAGVAAGSLGFGTLVAFISYTVNFYEPVKQFARVFNEFQYAQASAERVLTLIDTEPGIIDGKEIREKYGDVFNPKQENWPGFEGNIRFRDVSFSYDHGEEVLHGFNLEVKAGETIALVGETGSGKTTVVNLACRFYEPVSGEILIDGVDYRKRPLLWLHKNLGYVLQEPHLFSGTVRENIAYGRSDALEEEILRAARLVNAHEFIMKLEKGYDTNVGERGGRLSTGQKQLISFARAILANPGLFILDEATSSVDTETEQLIQEAIHTVLKGRTSFIIAHRLSTIRSADRILVIDKGRIIEEGSHKELLDKKGRYYRLYTNQFMEEQGERLLSEDRVS